MRSMTIQSTPIPPHCKTYTIRPRLFLGVVHALPFNRNLNQKRELFPRMRLWYLSGKCDTLPSVLQFNPFPPMQSLSLTWGSLPANKGSKAKRDQVPEPFKRQNHFSICRSKVASLHHHLLALYRNQAERVSTGAMPCACRVPEYGNETVRGRLVRHCAPSLKIQSGEAYAMHALQSQPSQASRCNRLASHGRDCVP